MFGARGQLDLEHGTGRTHAQGQTKRVRFGRYAIALLDDLYGGAVFRAD